MKITEFIMDLLKEQNITVFALSRECGIERSTLSKILNGKRQMSPQHFSRIISNIPISLDTAEQLRDEYIDKNFGKDRFMQYIKFYNGIRDSIESESLAKQTYTTLDLNGSTANFSTRIEFLSIADAVISDLIKAPGEKKRLYSNITLPSFYDVCKPVVSDSSVDFKILLSINNKKENFMENITKLIFFAINNCNIHYCNTLEGINNHIDVMFPYYVVTDEVCIFADASLEHGYLLKNKEIATININRFNYLMKTTKPYILHSNDVLQVKNMHNTIFSEKVERVLFMEDTICSGFCMSRDMWDEIAKPELPDREYLVDSTYEYYQTYREIGKSKLFITTADAIHRFVSTGIVSQIPEEYVNPLSVQSRLKVLTDYKAFITNGINEFAVAKSNMLMKTITEIFLKSKKTETSEILINSTSSKMPQKYLGNINFTIRDEITAREYADFMEHFAISNYCYNYKESIDILDQEINRCKYMAANEPKIKPNN